MAADLTSSASDSGPAAPRSRPEALPTHDAPYRKVPGSGTNGFLKFRLYRGSDHLLQVASSGFTETYKRFYFADIQAFTLQQTNTGKLWNVLWGGLAAIFLLLSTAAQPGALVLAGISLCYVGFLITNLAFGPTCVCFVHTAVQRQKMGALSRVRRAQRVIRSLHAEILQHQEMMSPEEISRRLEPPFAPSPPATVTPAP
jgi:hypothetical protein